MNLDPSALSMLTAVFALGALSLVMAGWQAVTRLPAMRKAGLSLQDAAHAIDLNERLPSSARRVNDNYNHLMEAPTVFYAMVLAIVCLGLADARLAACAWIYVALRVLHSLVQATFNRVAVRAVLYGGSWLALSVLIVAPLLHLAGGR